MPDSIFRTPEPPPPPPVSRSASAFPTALAIPPYPADPANLADPGDEGVIEDGRTPTDVNRNIADRDQKSLKLVLILGIGLGAIMIIAILLVLL